MQAEHLKMQIDLSRTDDKIVLFRQIVQFLQIIYRIMSKISEDFFQIPAEYLIQLFGDSKCHTIR